MAEPAGAGLLVRVRGCGLCGSDLEKMGRGQPGVVLGHEVEGERENGDRVTVVHHVSCGTCERCRAGNHSGPGDDAKWCGPWSVMVTRHGRAYRTSRGNGPCASRWRYSFR